MEVFGEQPADRRRQFPFAVPGREPRNSVPEFGGTALTNVNLTSGGFSALFPQSDGTVIAVGEGTVSPTQSGLVFARFNL